MALDLTIKAVCDTLGAKTVVWGPGSGVDEDMIWMCCTKHYFLYFYWPKFSVYCNNIYELCPIRGPGFLVSFPYDALGSSRTAPQDGIYLCWDFSDVVITSCTG